MAIHERRKDEKERLSFIAGKWKREGWGVEWSTKGPSTHVKQIWN